MLRTSYPSRRGLSKLHKPFTGAASHAQHRAIAARTTSTASHSLAGPPPIHGSSNKAPPEPAPPILTLSSSTLNTYHVSVPPTASQLKHATKFFTTRPPDLLFVAGHFRSFPPSSFPEVAFLGRSNVGKSSLLNALFGANCRAANVSKTAGRTRSMNGFGIGGPGLSAPGRNSSQYDQQNSDAAWKRFAAGGLVVVDMPGYGGGSHAEWGVEAMKYLSQRKQLRRTFVLIDSEHGLKKSDSILLDHLRRDGVPFQLVLSKVDKLLWPYARTPSPEKLSKQLGALRVRLDDIDRILGQPRDPITGEPSKRAVADVLCCSGEKRLASARDPAGTIGLAELRWAIMTACGLGEGVP